MKILNNILLFIFIFFISNTSQAQQPYVWPVATAPALSANFGELRSNHYHMGLDARTEQRENLLVKAIADGYVTRIKIEPWGFGRAIYINHSNGITSLYAHLNNFYPELENWVTQQQYILKQWSVDLEVPSNLFPVSKGQTIAYSGNTGGSMGPHLHFELRETITEKVLNPLVHGFSVPDKIAPDIIHLAVYDRCESTYEQSPRFIPLRKVNGIYEATSDIVVATDKVSFGITSYDRYSGSTNKNGIYQSILKLNGKEVIRFVLDSISYLDTRLLNAHIDYKTKALGGSYIQHLSRLPGNVSDIYKGGDGVISLEDTNIQSIEILVQDPELNTSTIKFKIRSADKLKNHSIKPGLRFEPKMINVFENNAVKFFLPDNAIYDAFTFQYKESKDVNENIIYQIHNTTVPVQTYFKINIFDTSKSNNQKVVMKRFSGSKKDFVKADYNDGWYSAAFREFGNFQLIEDTEPPVISAITKTATRISFNIKDNTEELKNFKALLNGKWIRFANDKQRAFIYNIDENCPKGNNELIIYVEDLAGNKAEKVFKFVK
ncbi:MAG: M23 family metallopeptidase [Ferruginibacter sp.]